MENFKLFSRMFFYVFVTTVITFVSLLDTVDSHHISDVTNLDWIKMGLKSVVPGLISLKAFLDTTVNNHQNSQDENSL